MEMKEMKIILSFLRLHPSVYPDVNQPPYGKGIIVIKMGRFQYIMCLALRLKKKSSTKQEQYGNKFNKNFKMAHIQKKKDYMMI